MGQPVLENIHTPLTISFVPSVFLGLFRPITTTAELRDYRRILRTNDGGQCSRHPWQCSQPQPSSNSIQTKMSTISDEILINLFTLYDQRIIYPHSINRRSTYARDGFERNTTTLDWLVRLRGQMKPINMIQTDNPPLWRLCGYPSTMPKMCKQIKGQIKGKESIIEHILSSLRGCTIHQLILNTIVSRQPQRCMTARWKAKSNAREW